MSAFRLAIHPALLAALVVLFVLLGSQTAAAQETPAARPAAPAFTYGPYNIVDAISQWCMWNAGYEQCFDVPPNPPTVRWTNGCKQIRLTYNAAQAFDGLLTVYGYFDGPSQPNEDLRATVNGVTSDWYDDGSGPGWHAITLPATYHFDAGENYIYLTHPQYPYPEDCKYWGSIHFTDPTETETGWFALGDPPAPGPPTNTGPADGSQYCAPAHPNVTLHWTCSGDSCYVQLARDSGFTNLVASYGWTTATSWDVTSYVQTGATYWWRVKARYGSVEGPYNGPWRFTVVTPTYVSGYIETDTTWPYHFCPYYELTDDVIVKPGVTLTIEPGVTVLGRSSTELRVLGYLSAVGTAALPIVFTSAQDTGQYQWSGLVFDGGSGELVHATVRYGGHSNSLYTSSNIAAHNVPAGTLRIASSQVISNSVVYGYSQYGLYAANSHIVVSDTLFSGVGYAGGGYALYATGASTVTVAGSTFQNNPGSGVYVASGTITVTHSTFQNNGGYGLYTAGDTPLWLTDSTFTGNGSYPLRTAPLNLNRALDSNTFSANTPNRLLTGGGALPGSRAFPAATGLAGLELDGDLTVPAGVTLTAEPGTTIWGRSSTELRVLGYLSAVGTAALPIVFTSAQDTGQYQWSGLVFDGGSGELVHATVRYGGHSNSLYTSSNIAAHNVPAGTLRIASSQVISNSVVYGYSQYGLYTANSHVVVSDTLFSGVGYSAALYATGVSTVTVTGATVQNNPGYGIYLNGADAATLTGNTIRANNGGGVYLNDSDAALQGNVIRENYAANGGGLYVAGDSRPALVNNVLLANRAGTVGSGLYVAGSARPALLHTTLAANTGGDGSGVYVAAGAAAVFTNTIVYSHTVGVAAAAGAAVTMANTLWDANTSDFTGAVVETGHLTGPAAFAADGYHLGPGSAALERGLDAGVSDDLDGESRPQPAGTSPDVGADESPLAGLLAAPAVSAGRDANGVELRWTQTQSGIIRYEVYRSTNPYFTPDGGSLLDGDVPAPGAGNQATFTDPFGPPRVNYYYLVLAVGAGEARSLASNRVGAFHFPLTPGAQ